MPKYTIRVYGIWINEKDEVLLSDERIRDYEFTKFPGGGMQNKEGTIDCLKREWREELNLEIEIISHLYTTDFYQASAFHESTQVISIYYRVKPKAPYQLDIRSAKNDFDYHGNREERHRWISLGSLSEVDLTFPIDKYIVKNIL